MSIFSRTAGWWVEQDSRRRTMWSLLLVAVLVATGSAAFYTTRVNFVPLFTGLDPAQAHAIVGSLKEQNVVYQLGDGGTSVLVPEARLHELRIMVAGEGLYNTGVGFELFDEARLGLTDFERRINYQRALQEELRRTISAYPAVDQVRVHLVIPERSVFVQQAAAASASITLSLRPFQSLSTEQVKGMVYLVALSVPNLKRENVTIVDVGGRILTAGLNLGENAANPTLARQGELQRGFEREIEARLLGMLERLYGPGQAVVVVTAELNFNQESVTRIVYDAAGQVVRSEQIAEENFTGPAGQAGGVAGAGSNVPLYPTGEATEGTSTYSKVETNRQFEIGTTETTTVTAPGQVTRLSAAVTVNGELNEAQVSELNQLVRAALGYEEARGDSIRIAAMPFSRVHIEQAEQQMTELARQAEMRQYVNWGIMGAGGLLGFILLLVIIGKIRQATRFEVAKTQAVDLVPLKEALAQAAAAKSTTESDAALNRVKEIASKQPEEVALLIKAWFNEG
ncbi:MAG: Flagellar M-ring protein [Firmicutes bacterium]|nr:Flagellar M-ring protein [Bacillota bacterium]